MTDRQVKHLGDSQPKLALKPFYVYELVDPTDQRVFYVGKGQGNRGNEHLKSVADADDAPSKTQRIRLVRASGNEPIVRVIGRYSSEEQAFAVEATLIHWVYGIENLTNVQGGHGNATIRTHGDLTEIEGVDIPRALRRWDGEYSAALKSAREQHSIVPLIQSLRDYLRAEVELDFSEPDTRRADRTRIYRDFGLFKLRLGAFHSEAPAIILRLENSNRGPDVFEKFCLENHLVFTGKRPPYNVAKLPDFDRSKEFAVIAQQCAHVRDLVNA